MFCLTDRILLFVHYTISLSSLCKLIWRHWTYKMPVGYILSSVWVRFSLFSRLSFIYRPVCFQFTHFHCDDWDNTYTLCYYHHQIWSMNYYPLFRVRSWNFGMRCMSLYIVMTPSRRQAIACTMSHLVNDCVSSKWKYFLSGKWHIFLRNLHQRYFEFAFNNMNRCSYDTSHSYSATQCTCTSQSIPSCEAWIAGVKF